jgi:hypothetical protein
VVAATPKFSSNIYAPTTLWDLIENIYYQQMPEEERIAYVGDIVYYRDIWPIVQRAPLLSWVNGQANGGHGE